MSATNIWYRVIRDLGFEVSADELGDLRWTDEGVSFVCMVEPADPTYLRIVIPRVWYDESPSDEAMALASRLVHQVNGQVKVAKLILGAHGVHASAEAFYPTYDIASRHIYDLTQMLRVAGHLFSERFFVNEEEGSDDDPEPLEPWQGG